MRRFKKMAQSLILLVPMFSNGQITSSGIKGNVSSGATFLQSASVTAVHNLTNEKYNSSSQKNGDFYLNNLKSGGPYTLICSHIGYVSDTIENVYLQLGNYFSYGFKLLPFANELKEVLVTGRRDKTFNSKRKGAATNIDSHQFSELPTIGRSIQDFTRLSPQANGNSFAGTNYRYNNLSLDGAALNDAFGFTEPASGAGGSQATGTPGSLARTQPVSLESVQEIQVSVAPFNVTTGNFTGGSINAVTRSGTNKTQGSAFFSGRNQMITGKSADKERKPIDKFYDFHSGFRVGGAIIKNKLFYFTSAEISRRKEPVLFAPGRANSAIPQSLAKAIADTLQSRYGYNSGSYSDVNIQSNSEIFFVRLDWNINSRNKLHIRNNYVNGFGDYLERGANSLNYESQGYRHISKTNSTVLELKSNFFSGLSNTLILGHTVTNDRRDIRGNIFPHLEITYNTANVIFAGAYREAAIYGLTLKTNQLTDNLIWNRGKHTITFGTNNEFYNVEYRFLTAWNGRWAFSSPENFFANKPSRIRGVYNLSNNDYQFNKNNASANFRVFLLSQYLQDELNLTKSLTITAGLRLDYTFQPDAIETNTALTSITKFSQYKNQINKKPLLALRLGFNWDVSKNKTLQLRGGTGIFNGRMPFNWLAYPYYNDGRRYGNVDYRPGGSIIPLNNDLSQIASTYQPGITEINLLDNNFKLPQIWRTSLAVDYKTKNRWVFTLEGIYSETLNDVLYQTINLKDSAATLAGSGDNRKVFLGSGNAQKINPAFTNVFLLTNTKLGYKYQLSATVSKTFKNDFSIVASYTYGVSKDVVNGARNSPQANWEFNQTIDPNTPLLSFSNADIRHRLFAVIQKQVNWQKIGYTSISLVYSIQSGSPYSYVYSGDINRDGSPNNDLIYVPTNTADANLVDIKDNGGNVIVTAAQQWNNLDNYINNDKYLRQRRGTFAERNGARTPWNHQMDMKLTHTLPLKSTGKNIQVSLDVFNLSNFISRNWGKQYFVPNLLNGNYQLLSLNSISNSTKPNIIFNKPSTSPWQVDAINSRAQGQVSIRLNF